jgi:hypothetical protein
MLGKWYETHRGVSLTPTDYGKAPWRQESGPTVWGAFPADTDYFGDVSRQ